MFEIKSYVVYKNDICYIDDIKEYGNKKYYVLVPINDKSLKINLPVDNENIRKVMSKDMALKVIDMIKDVPIVKIENEKNLELEYRKLLSSNDYSDLISIIKTTYLRNENRKNEKKKLGEIDRKYFEIAESKLYNELSIPLEMSAGEVKESILKKISEI